MKQTEVTQNQWLELFELNPSVFRSGSRPVEGVSWFDACVYCNRRSLAEGLRPCYYDDHLFTSIFEGLSHPDHDPIFWDQTANGYRLPTEAEWEYACRAGSESSFYNGKNITTCTGMEYNLNPLAWYWKTSANYTQPVAGKLPNKWNLYDMLGNVFEWCWDKYDDNYYSYSPSIDPTGATRTGIGRCCRGGSYNRRADQTRCGYRLNGSQSQTITPFHGFRVVKSAE